MELEYRTLIKKILNCNSMDELIDVIEDSNKFLKKYEIPKNSKIFEKLDTLIGIIKLNLRKKRNYRSESIKNENLHSLSESEVDLIVKKILENENFSK
ncbi:MAG: hypothetical protein RL311_1094 [Bacteroidota bacterium]|jgi:hypothetical protein